MEFLRLFLRRHSVRKPLLASRKVGCVLSLYSAWQAQKAEGEGRGGKKRKGKEGGSACKTSGNWSVLIKE